MKAIPGTDGKYSVTEDGRVWSHISNIWLKLVPVSKDRGYHGVSVRMNGKFQCHGVHRLVALTYVPNPNNKSYVNHKDYNPLNNHYSNLEWVTASENILWSAKIGSQSRFGKINGRYKYPREIVDKALEMHREGTPTLRISKILNLPNTLTKKYITGELRKTL